MKRLLIALLGSIFLLSPNIYASALDLTQDSSGWTVFAPSSDSRIMYVSTSGNDTTGTVYTTSNHPVWSTPFLPGEIQPYLTVGAAYANVRNGYPDWVLIKRGDTFTGNIGNIVKSGRSTSEPLLIGSYGSSGSSPIFKTGALSGIYLEPNSGVSYTQRYVAISGLSFYAHTRNPSDAGYVDATGSKGFSLAGRYISNILMEGCSFRFYTENNVSGEHSYSRATDITVRRSLILDSYDPASHSQGLIGSHTENFLFEENILDHNGWLIQNTSGTPTNPADGMATYHNHSTYFSGDLGSIFRKNISIRPSSIHFKHAVAGSNMPCENLLHDGNLLIDGEIGNDVAGNDANYGPGANNWTFSNNVLYKIGLSNTVGRNLSRGITVANIGTGGAEIKNNLVLNSGITQEWGSQELVLGADQSYEYESQVVKNTTIHDNIFIGAIGKGYSTLLIMPSSGSTLTNNYFQLPTLAVRHLWSAQTNSAVITWAFSGNRYYHPSGSTFRTSDVIYTEGQWLATNEQTATFTKKTFPDESRTVETYMASINGTGTVDGFTAAVRAQDRYNWNTAYTAPVVNQWIRTGFGMGGTKYKNVKSITQETP